MLKRAVLALALCAGQLPAKTLLYLPVSGDLEKDADVSTVNELFKDAVQAAYEGDIKVAPHDSAAAPCTDKECAAKLAAAAGVDEVVYATVKRLGSKWIFSATRYSTATKLAFNQRGTSVNLEDLEAVTKRVSDALLQGKTVDQVASLDNITGKEETTEPTRRRSLFNTGFSLGYIYPSRHKYAYLKDTSDNAFGCGEEDCEERQLRDRIIRLAFINSWEFRENYMMGFELNWGMPNVIGGDINMQYLFTRTDFSPFLGGGLGLQYVIPLDDTVYAYKENAGPALNIQGGMLFFRTYDIHLMARAQYQWIFNDDGDRGMVYDVGVVYRPDRRGSGWGTFWKFYLVGALILATVGSVGD